MDARTCPDKDSLLGFVVGTIPETEADTVAQHLAACPECEETVQDLERISDTLINALRQPAGHDTHADEPECRQALENLRRLRVGQAESKEAKPTAPVPKRRRSTQLGDYQLLKKLGQGGMGAVYKARHAKLKRVVALKVLPRDRLQNEEAVARFEREMEAVGRLDHANIARATDARQVGNVRFLVMEYIDGLDLSEIVKRCGPLGIAEACEVIRQAAEGLACSQENGLVHREWSWQPRPAATGRSRTPRATWPIASPRGEVLKRREDLPVGIPPLL